MGDDRNLDIRKLTQQAESDKPEDQDAFHKTMDSLKPDEVRAAMRAMVNQNYSDRHDAQGHEIPGVPQLSIKYEDGNPNREEALVKSEQRAFYNPMRLFGDMASSEAYRPADETMLGQARDYIQAQIAKINPFQPIITALDQSTQQH